MGIRLPICIALALAGTLHVSANVVDMRCEYRVDPIGIDATAPRLTWTYDSDDIPVSCSVQLSETPKFKNPKQFDSNDLWSAIVSIDRVAGRKYYWRVVQFMDDGRRVISSVASFETGKFTPAQWNAAWIIANDYALDFGLLGSKSVLRMLSKYDYNDTVRLPDHTAEFRSGHHKFKISKISEATRLSGSLDFTFF